MLISSCAVVCWMAASCVGKLKAPVVKQKSFKNRSKWSRKFDDFSKPTGKWTLLLCAGKKNRAGNLNFGKEMALWSMSFETAVSSLDFIYRKLRQTLENPQKTTK